MERSYLSGAVVFVHLCERLPHIDFLSRPLMLPLEPAGGDLVALDRVRLGEERAHGFHKVAGNTWRQLP
jgi:hypothetical protein